MTIPTKWNNPWAVALWLTLLARVSLFVVGALGMDLLPLRHRLYTEPFALDYLKTMYYHWDATWYVKIATQGYWKRDAFAFFPLYPFLIRLFSEVFGGRPLWAGVFVNTLATWVALWAYVRVAALDVGHRRARRGALYLVAFPTAFFLTALYTEALFLALTLLVFLLARQRRWWWAGFFGLLAALTRNVGVLSMVPIAWEYGLAMGWWGDTWKTWWRRFPRWRELPGLAPVLLVPLGVLLFALYGWWQVGDALAFLHAQSNWHRVFSLPPLSLWRAAVAAARGYSSVYNGLDLTASLFALAVLAWGAPRLRPVYTWWAGISLLLYLSTVVDVYALSVIMSLSRFVLVLFPMYLAMSLWEAEWAAEAALAISFMLQAFFFILFSHGYWVA